MNSTYSQVWSALKMLRSAFYFILLVSISSFASSSLVDEDAFEAQLCPDITSAFSEFGYVKVNFDREGGGMCLFNCPDTSYWFKDWELDNSTCNLQTFYDNSFSVRYTSNKSQFMDYYYRYEDRTLYQNIDSTIKCIFNSSYQWECLYENLNYNVKWNWQGHFVDIYTPDDVPLLTPATVGDRTDFPVELQDLILKRTIESVIEIGL